MRTVYNGMKQCLKATRYGSLTGTQYGLIQVIVNFSYTYEFRPYDFQLVTLSGIYTNFKYDII